MEGYCYINGAFVPADRPQLHVDDLGLLRGYGLFDFFRTHHRKPFLFSHHADRFYRSAQQMDLDIPLDAKALRSVVEELIGMHSFPEVGIRMVLTGGYSPDQYLPTSPNLIILAHPLSYPSYVTDGSGCKLITWPYKRELPTIKTTNYAVSIMAQKECMRQGASDVLFHINGLVSEVSRSNFFIVKRNKMITPQSGILLGVTRKVVMELAKGICEVEERNITLAEVFNADEAFMTGTTKKVCPITHIDGQSIGNGNRPITNSLRNAFADFEESESVLY